MAKKTDYRAYEAELEKFVTSLPRMIEQRFGQLARDLGPCKTQGYYESLLTMAPCMVDEVISSVIAQHKRRIQYRRSA